MSTIKNSLDLIQQLTVDHLIERFQSGDISPSRT